MPGGICVNAPQPPLYDLVSHLGALAGGWGGRLPDLPNAGLWEWGQCLGDSRVFGGLMSVCPARAMLELRVKEAGPPPSTGSWQGARLGDRGVGLGSGHQLLPSEGPEASLCASFTFRSTKEGLSSAGAWSSVPRQQQRRCVSRQDRHHTAALPQGGGRCRGTWDSRAPSPLSTEERLRYF